LSREPHPPSASDARPLVTLLVPAYNEAGILQANLTRICAYLETLADRYRWELVVVDDGSDDGTDALARAFAASRPEVRVQHHPANFGLGQALATGFRHSRGDYVVVLDIDLTYSVEHVGALLERIRTSRARVVVASPYMKGGRSSGVPLLRRLLSRWGNRFLGLTARPNLGGRLSTLTGMVRAYDGPFIRSLNLKSMGNEVNIEIVYKAMILGARIEEIPGHVDWSAQRERAGRTSGRRIRRSIALGLFAGYIIRPFAFFIVPAALLALVSVYPLFWAVHHVIAHYPEAARSGDPIDFVISEAVARAFRTSPHSFIVGGITLVLSVQLFSLGILALQVKHVFEELFHFGARLDAGNRRLEQLLSAEQTPSSRSAGLAAGE
jgi:glycosyltransferase involved in cell wall biosynthesis